jgi:predicted acetyltransferase
VPELVRPHVRYHWSFVAAMEEFAAEGRTGDRSMVGDDIATFASTWGTPEGFAAYVDRLLLDATEPRKAEFVECTSFFWVGGEEYLGRIAVRHRLNAWLSEVGGHIGYDVRRSARGHGHATAMLEAVKPFCLKLGIDRALVTCDVDNLASRRVIEKCGGVLEDERLGKLRFWVPTA